MMRDSNFFSSFSCSLNSFAIFGLAVLAFVCSPQLSVAEDSPIIHIEEDWKVEIGTPDPDGEAPQIVTAMLPHGKISEYYSLFELNHVTLPEYDAGGMQLQLWQHEANKKSHSFPSAKKMRTKDEVVTFTMKSYIDEGKLFIEVVNGTSTTWGKFGGQGHLITSQTTQQNNLNSYNPDASIKHSRVGFGSNRVKKFVRTEIRYYSQNGLIKKTTSESVVTTLGNSK